tara:strand:- start:4 stop:885 length:882 start_codon:yes stop_codon:yes gene_type:complete
LTAPLTADAQLVMTFEAMTSALTSLATALRSSTLPLWVPLTDQEQAANLDPRQKAIDLYCDIWHADQGDGRRTRSCHGLIASDPALLAAAADANLAKSAFRQSLAVLKKERQTDQKKTPDDLLEPLNQRPNALREALEHKGLARLHLKQCYRLIPAVPRQPERVGFNWYTSGRSIKRITLDQAQQMLLRLGIDKPHVQLQLDRLQRLSPDTSLAQIQQQAPLMRANLSYPTAPLRQAMNLSLPLLFGYDPEQPFPEHNSPSLIAQAQRSRQIRSDSRIDLEPFLASLRIHLYR